MLGLPTCMLKSPRVWGLALKLQNYELFTEEGVCALAGSLPGTAACSDAERMPVGTEGELELAVKGIEGRGSPLLVCLVL